MAKSIIDIEVKDEAFKAFSALFDKYQKQLAKMPDAWAKVGAEASAAGQVAGDSTGKAFLKASKSIDDTAQKTRQIAKNQQANTKATHDFNKSLNDTARLTKSIAENVASSVFSLAKWAALGGIVGIATGAGGLFGLSSLAQSASTTRRTSQELGVTSGQLQSARVAYGQYFDSDAMLGNIANAQSDIGKRYSLTALGVNQQDMASKNAAQLLPDLLPKMVELFKRGGSTQQGMQAYGLNNITDINTMRELSALSPRELAKRAAEMKSGANQYGMTDRTLETMQNFERQLHSAGTSLENTFITGLAPLTSNLGHLSDSVTKAIQSFLKNPKMGQWIDEFGQSIEKAAKYMQTEDFARKVGSFVDGIGALGDAISKVLEALGLKKKEEKPFVVQPGSSGSKWAQQPNAVTKFAAQRVNEIRYGLPNGLLYGIYGQESSFGNNQKKSSAGAIGPYQHMPAFSKYYHEKDPTDFLDSTRATAEAMSKYMKMYGGDVDKSLVAYNWGPGNLNKALNKYGANWRDHLPAESANYIPGVRNNMTKGGYNAPPRVDVRIMNAPGTDTITQAKQVAQ